MVTRSQDTALFAAKPAETAASGMFADGKRVRGHLGSSTRQCSGAAVCGGASVLALFPNKTWKSATTDQSGMAAMDLHSGKLPMTVFAAAEGHAAHLARGPGCLTAGRSASNSADRPPAALSSSGMVWVICRV